MHGTQYGSRGNITKLEMFMVRRTKVPAFVFYGHDFNLFNHEVSWYNHFLNGSAQYLALRTYSYVAYRTVDHKIQKLIFGANQVINDKKLRTNDRQNVGYIKVGVRMRIWTCLGIQ